jgi:hypothetical protein
MADELVIFILLGLATYRLATDIAWEDGPFDVFSVIRGQALQRFGAAHWVTNGVGCPICLSFWIAPALIILWNWAPALVWWLAVAGVAALLARK